MFHFFLSYFKDNFERVGDNGAVSRDHMLMALANIQTILIRARFVNDQYFAAYV